MRAADDFETIRARMIELRTPSDGHREAIEAIVAWAQTGTGLDLDDLGAPFMLTRIQGAHGIESDDAYRQRLIWHIQGGDDGS